MNSLSSMLQILQKARQKLARLAAQKPDDAQQRAYYHQLVDAFDAIFQDAKGLYALDMPGDTITFSVHADYSFILETLAHMLRQTASENGLPIETVIQDLLAALQAAEENDALDAP